MQILRLHPYAVALVGSTCQHKVLQLCNHCGRINRILQLSWSHPIVSPPDPASSDKAKETTLSAWLSKYPKLYSGEKLEVRVAAHAVLYSVYCALHTKLARKKAFDTSEELVIFPLSYMIF